MFTRRLCISIVVCSQCSIVKFTELILWYMNLMNNGKMDCGNENPTQHLPWWLRKTTKKPQSGWSAPGFEPGTSLMRGTCVTTKPPRSVILVLFMHFLPEISDLCRVWQNIMNTLLEVSYSIFWWWWWSQRWSRGNIVTSHAAGLGSIPGRVNFLVDVFPGFSFFFFIVF